MSIYKLSGTGTGGTEDALAQLDVQFDGIITAVTGHIRSTMTGAGQFATAEISFLSNNTVGTNDTRGSIFSVSTSVTGTTSGFFQGTQHNNAAGLAVRLNAGERIWLHFSASAGLASEGQIYVYVEDGQDVPTAQRRR